MTTDSPLRFIHLLTMWRERPARPGQPAVWRFSLEDIQTRQRHGFADLDALVAFLRARMERDDRNLYNE